MALDRRRLAVLWLVGLSVGGIAALLILGPIPQPAAYHDFADRRPWIGMPNAADVLSNAAFLAVGAAGLLAVARSRRDAHPPEPWERRAFSAYAAGLACTAVGSAVYHLHPTDASLVWDRLPMSVTFAALAALLFGERLSPRAGRLSLVPLALLGVASVALWAWTLDRMPGGDLRAYVLVKYATLAAAILLLVFVPEPRATRAPVWQSLAAFCAATAFEIGDASVFRATGGLLSGHTVKHVVAALAAAFVLGWFSRRRALAQ